MRIGAVVAVATCAVSFTAGAVPAGGDSTTPYTNYLVTATQSSPNRSVGRLVSVFRNGPQNEEVCSAAVVHSHNGSTLITAGHCVYNRDKGGFAISSYFAPGVQDGQKPFGKWRAARFTPSRDWVVSSQPRYDYAFVTVLPARGRRSVEKVVGGLPIAFNQPRDQAYHVLGYPASAPYDGTKLWACDAEYAGDVYDPDPNQRYGPPDMYANCDFNRGASGGPWLNPAGEVSSVTTTSFTGAIGGPYLGDDAAAQFAAVQALRLDRYVRQRRH